MTLEIDCYAKINESLLVGARDDRGYHPIWTIFQTISLADRLVISDQTDVDSFFCSAALPSENTVIKAWSLVRELISLPPLQVLLEKRIPMQSGLGGGSADAAGFLRGIHSLMGGLVSWGALADAAFAVGADVPFLLRGGRAIGEGYGEKLTYLPDGEERWLVLARPAVDCATPAMYAALDSISRDVSLSGRSGNDFELVAPSECVDLIESLRDLGGLEAGLSGSGSAVFGFFASEIVAAKAASRLEASWKVTARTVKQG